MGEAQEIQLQIMGKEAREANSLDEENTKASNQSTVTLQRTYKWWLLMAIFTLFLLVGQSAATLLGRLYFDKGGNSKWMATFVQPCGFPLLLPLYFLLPGKSRGDSGGNVNSPSVLVLGVIYVSLGVVVAVDCLLFSLGLLHLPVSTYSLICASQLAFNALFSFFLNSQKFTPFIINSVVLLTISSVLLVFHKDKSSDSNDVSKGKYAIGFICTIVASAGYGLILSLTQFFFQKVLKRVTVKAVLDFIIYPSIVATCAVLVGLFASGEWRSLKGEMEEFKLGKLSYLMTLIWTAICWQVFSIGSVGLIFKVSALFSNVISTLGLPVVPVLAVVFFEDKMSGVKVISMVLAIWGFVSYVCQHYLDDYKSKTEASNPTTEELLVRKMQNP